MKLLVFLSIIMIGCTNKPINTEKDIINSDTSLSNILERSSKHLQQSGIVVQDANEKQVKEVKNIVTSIVTFGLASKITPTTPKATDFFCK